MTVPSRITDILYYVASAYRVSPVAIISSSKEANVLKARNIGIAIARELTDFSTTVIGKKFNRDHSTVLYAVKKAHELYEDEFILLRDEIKRDWGMMKDDPLDSRVLFFWLMLLAAPKPEPEAPLLKHYQVWPAN